MLKIYVYYVMGAVRQAIIYVDRPCCIMVNDCSSLDLHVKLTV